jgi:hypothetical protein
MKTLLLIPVLMGLMGGDAFAGAVVDSTRNQTIIAGEYFIDTDPGEGSGTPIVATYGEDEVSVDFDLIPSPSKNSVIYVRFQSSNSLWSPPQAFRLGSSFPNPNSTVMEAEYFVNTDPGVGNGTPVSVDAEGDLGFSLPNLLRGDAVYIRTRDSSQRWSPPRPLEYRFGKILSGEMYVKFKSGGASDVVTMTVEEDESPYSVFYTAMAELHTKDDIDSVFVRLMTGDYFWGEWFGGDFFPPPVLVSPDDGSTDLPTSVELVWRSVVDAVGYDAQVANDEGFADLVADLSAIADTATVVSDLRHGSTYYWRARTVGGEEESDWSAHRSFSIRELLPPDLVSPVDQAQDQETTLDLLWRQAVDAVDYELQLAENDIFTDIVLSQTALTDTSLTVGPLLHEAQLYWRVRTTSGPDTSAWSAAWSFTTGAFLPPVLVSPVDGADDVSVTPLLVWRTAFDADSYALQVARDLDFLDLALDVEGLSDTTRTLDALPRLETFYWRVRSATAEVLSDWSDPWSFTTQALQGPELASPADGAQDQPRVLTLSWNPVAGAASYRLQVARDAGFSDIVTEAPGLTETSFEVGPLRFGLGYYWRVEADDGMGGTGWSETWSFSTLELPAPTLLSPSDDAQNQPTTLDLAWSSVGDAGSYHLQLATDAGFVSLELDEAGLAGTTHTVGPLQEMTQYFWRVRSISEPDTSAWSDAWSFTTLTVLVIYPGDANNDAVVDVRDVLPIGLHYDRAGPVRPGGSLEWGPQELREAWVPEEAAHADCDGNGRVQAADVTGIVENWRAVRGGPRPAADVEEAYWAIVRALSGWESNPDLAPARDAILERLATLGVSLDFRVGPAVPNPFRASVAIHLVLPERTPVSLTVYDLQGRLVWKESKADLAPGPHTFHWSGTGEEGNPVSAGVYFYRLRAGEHHGSGRVLLVQ